MADEDERKIKTTGGDEPIRGEDEFEEVGISDDDLSAEDEKGKQAKKTSRKNRKNLRTPEEIKRAKRRKIFLASGLILLVILAIFIVPLTRWWTLNHLGIRSSMVVTIAEEASNRPINEAQVEVAEQQGLTDSFGRVQLNNLPLGPLVVTAYKNGYSRVETKVVSRLGTTKPADISLKVIGISFNVDIKDWLSGSAIEGATVAYSDQKSLTDSTGRASLVLPPTDKATAELTISSPNYLEKKVTTDVTIQSREVSLVSSAKNYFISKRDGKFDIFSSQLDGSNQQKIIEASNKEDENLLQFSIDRSNKQAVLVATREGTKINNRIVAGIYAVNLEGATLKKVDEGTDIQLLDWIEDTMIYTKAVPNLGYDDPAASRIMSYNTTTGRVIQLAESNYFALIAVAHNKVFYALTDYYRPVTNASVTSTELPGSVKRTYLAGQTVNYGVRTSYDILQLQLEDGRTFEIQSRSGATKQIDRRPGTPLYFMLSPASDKVLWSDRRDGQGALILQTLSDGKETVVARIGGLTAPVRFVGNDMAVVRIATSVETADYIVHLPTGKLAKIVDVSHVGLLRPGGL